MKSLFPILTFEMIEFIHLPWVTKNVGSSKTCCNKELIIFSPLKSHCFFWFGLTNSLYMSQITSFFTFDIWHPPTFFSLDDLSFTMWTRGKVLTFIIEAHSFFFHLLLFLSHLQFSSFTWKKKLCTISYYFIILLWPILLKS